MMASEGEEMRLRIKETLDFYLQKIGVEDIQTSKHGIKTMWWDRGPPSIAIDGESQLRMADGSEWLADG